MLEVRLSTGDDGEDADEDRMLVKGGVGDCLTLVSSLLSQERCSQDE